MRVFLWDEDAKLREEGAVLNNSRSEPKSRQVPAAQDGWDAGRSRGGMFAGVDPMAKGTDGDLQKWTMRLQTMTALHRLILRSDIISAEQNEKPTQRTWTVIMKVRMTSC